MSSSVTIAVLGKPRGNRGEITCTSLSSKPERFEGLREVFLCRPFCKEAGKEADKEASEETRFTVEEVWNHGGVFIFKFEGIDSIDDAEKWRGAEVRVPKSERVQLEPGEFFHSDLIGCELRDLATARVYGKITDVQEYGGPTLLEINDGEMLVPFVKAICVDIRPDLGYVAANLPEGLDNLDRP